MQRCFDLEVSHAKIAPAEFTSIHLALVTFFVSNRTSPDRKRNLKCALGREFPSKRDFLKYFLSSIFFSWLRVEKGQKQCACNQRKREQSFGPWVLIHQHPSLPSILCSRARRAGLKAAAALNLFPHPPDASCSNTDVDNLRKQSID